MYISTHIFGFVSPFAIFTFIQGKERERVEEMIKKKNAWSEGTLARSGIFMILWVMVSYMLVRKWKDQVKTNACKKLKNITH